MPSSPNLVAQIYINVGTGFPTQILSTSVPGPLCHIPHKEWATPDEAQNYYYIERWAYQLHVQPFPCSFRLHIPHKTWANDLERDNYLFIERWTLETQTEGYKRPLHIPSKEWAYDDPGDAPTRPEEELDNYRYLEWWSTLFAGYPGIKGGVPPLYPNLVVQIYENVT